MPKKFPPEFKRDVVTVARRGDPTVPEVAADFDVWEESVRRWVKQADRDDGIVAGQTSSESGSPPQATTRLWRPSSACSRTMSSTGAAAAPARSSTTRSCFGSSTPTTAAAVNDHSAGSPRWSSSKRSPHKPVKQ